MGQFIEQRVVPYYLRRMAQNATSAQPGLLAEVAASGRPVTLDEVSRLLAPPQWREQVTGAWYAVVLDSRALRDPLCAALVSCGGSLTSPPLAIAATVTLGADALPALRAYEALALADSYLGGAEPTSACIEFLGGQPSGDISESGRRVFAELRYVAAVLRSPQPSR